MTLLADLEASVGFYADRYDILDQWTLTPGKKIYLGDKQNRKCRFCDKSEPKVTFKKEAHAIPELLGNKSIFSYYECDTCNDDFGKGIENDLGNWSKPIRTLSTIAGKSGIPAIKGTNSTWRIEGTPYNINISHDVIDTVFQTDEEKKEITFRITRDSYTPIAVHKAFIKMAITLIPEKELINFKLAMEWIRDRDHATGMVFHYPVGRSFLPGAYRRDIITIFLLRRKSDDMEVPYLFMALSYGPEMFQVFLPSPEKDSHLMGKQISFYRFPTALDFNPAATEAPYTSPLDLRGTAVVKGDVVTLTMSYGDKIPVAHGSANPV